MCLGIPMQVVAVDGNAATCSSRSGLQHIDLSLVGPVVPGEWLLTFLGAARGRLDADEAARIGRALDALESIERGEQLDVAAFFADLVDRGPQLPEHLRGEK
jgi:hydrogenase expression/formation protein HypC